MNKLPVLRFPDPRLRTIAKEVLQFDDSILQLVDDMYTTMYEEKGVGLAATQVNRHIRVVVTDCGHTDKDKSADSEDDTPNPIEFINPVITHKSDDVDIQQEGCLSVPEIYADIERAKVVTIKALNRHGEPFTMVCEGLHAICIQHEIDHLNGKLFVDYLSAAKRNLIREKMKKYEKRRIKESQEANPNA